MRVWIVVLACVLAFGARAADVEHVRGEFRFATGPVPAFVQALDIPDQWEPAAPGATDAAWRVWLSDQQIDRRNAADHVYIDYAYEAKSGGLLTDAGKYEIDFDPTFQRLVLHGVDVRRAGKWGSRLVPERITLARREDQFESDMATGSVSALVVLDDIRVDDVVRMRYSVIGSNPIMGGMIADGTWLAWSHPLRHARMRVLYEPGTRPALRHGSGAVPARVQALADAVEVVFEAKAAAPVRKEDSHPGWYRAQPYGFVSRPREWRDVVAWALPLYPTTGELPADLQLRVRQWAALKGANAKARAALRAVQDDVRYFGVEIGDSTHRPAAPATTWTRRFGDCKDKAALLVAILRKLDIEAAPALVGASRGRGTADVPPSVSSFDHVIVRATVGGETVWMDPTLTAQGGDPQGNDLSPYGYALVIAPGSNALVPIEAPARGADGITVSETFEPAVDGRSLALSIRTRYAGTSADVARRQFAGDTGEARTRRFLEYYRKQFGDVQSGGPTRLEDDRDANILTVHETYRIADPFKEIGGDQTLDLHAESIAAQTPNVVGADRIGPLLLGRPGRYVQESTMRLPPDWSTSQSKESVRHAAQGLSYKRDVAIDPGQLVLTHTLDLNTREVPASEVAEHARVLREMRDGLSRRVYLSKPVKLQREARDARLKALLRDSIEKSRDTP